MQNSTKRVLLLGLFSILFISLFINSIGSVSAVTLAEKVLSGNTNVLSSIGFANWSTGDLINSPILLRILFLILVVLLVYSAMGTFLESSPGLNFGVSAVVGLISIGFITDDMLRAVGTEYGVLGLTLTAILPFIILSFFTLNVARTGKPNARVLQLILWWFFFAFLLIRLLMGIDFDKYPEAEAYFIIITLAALVVALTNSMIVKALMKLFRKAVISKATDTSAKAVAREKTLAKEEEVLGGSPTREMDKDNPEI